MEVVLKEVIIPKKDNSGVVVQLSDETLAQRKEKVISSMKKNDLDILVIYNDLEHYGNFNYLTGFVTRFEEGLLVLHSSGEAFLILGNENTKMVNYSRIPATLIHTPLFSLPDQPMDGEQPLENVFKEAGVKATSSVGVVGWKMFTTSFQDNNLVFDIPSYIITAIQNVVTDGKIENRTDLFIHSEYGVRVENNANEIAYYEYGASLSSDCVLDAIQEVQIGKTELDIADKLIRYGQVPNVVPIAAFGERFEKAYIYPRNKAVELGDKISITTGYKGGLTSRAGYAVSKSDELPKDQRDYVQKVTAPYFNAFVAWLENITIGMKGRELYSLVEEVLPKGNYNWHLNPGHLTSEEEWLSSPIKSNSEISLKSGMIFQIDIIPSITGYAGAGCEGGIALADETLIRQIEKDYPQLWERINNRKQYMREQLGIKLPNCVLPMGSSLAYYAPFFLNPKLAFVKK